MFDTDSFEIFVPDGTSAEDALKRTTHLAIAAHQDDIELFAADGILKCFLSKDKWFSGITVADGRGSTVTGKYSAMNNDEIFEIRKKEQKKAAVIGEYSASVLLSYPSSEVKNPDASEIVCRLAELIDFSRPEVIYTHNPADKHPTHVGVAVKTIQAIRMLDRQARPKMLAGCEVWRDLDWMDDDAKIKFDLTGGENILSSLINVYDSQIDGGKNYAGAITSRRIANATFISSRGTDSSRSMGYAMDLTPLIEDDNADIADFVCGHIDDFCESVRSGIGGVLGR